MPDFLVCGFFYFGFFRCTFADIIASLRDTGLGWCMLLWWLCTLISLPQLFSLNFTRTPKLVGKGQWGNSWGKNPHIIFSFLMRKPKGKKGTQYTRGCWQNILLGCGFDQITISAGIECVLFYFLNHFLISLTHSPLWALSYSLKTYAEIHSTRYSIFTVG